MGVIAQWRNKRWEVSNELVTAITSLSASRKLKSEQSDTRSGSASTNVVGFEAEAIPISYDVSGAVGADALAEYNSWFRLAGKTGTLLIAGKPFGPRRLMLDEVAMDILQLSNSGDIHLASISLSFSQDDASKNNSGATPTGISATGAKKSTGEISSALKVGPTVSEKKRVKG